ncbi:ABC transporter ATP-binding protein [Falsibacillus pallidus]|uniref:ABC-2 type transport system ATP-binding protein n=1 Tax=Falsibacillus pallidus TaxID=493781 RepID=A0A370GNW8_9BACI|nr:ABC transporter ATP-binding protein [Falsibacillus pallidus]RDI45425.1 ABC-2 type transport system ATP-binding protein [Falsibacillus pallidus]
MIKMNDIKKSIDGVEIIHNVSFQIRKGSIYGLLGSNGAGKTTLLKTLSGIYLQEEGSVEIEGKPVFENPTIKDKIFFIPDAPTFFSQFNLDQMAQFYKNTYPGWNDDRYLKLVQEFQIDSKKRLHKFSKGVQRQSAFILALSTMPEVLILDEPMDGLDPVVRKKVKSLLIDDVAEREMTILISSHNLREVEDICDHVGVLHGGKLLFEKELDDLKTSIHKIQVAFKDHVPNELFEALDPLHRENRGSVVLAIVKGNEARIAEMVERYNPVIFDLLPLTLEEIFIYEMGDVGYVIKNIMD